MGILSLAQSSNSNMLMMEPAEKRQRDDGSSSVWASQGRRVIAQCQMGPDVLVMGGVGFENSMPRQDHGAAFVTARQLAFRGHGIDLALWRMAQPTRTRDCSSPENPSYWQALSSAFPEPGDRLHPVRKRRRGRQAIRNAYAESVFLFPRSRDYFTKPSEFLFNLSSLSR